MPLTGKQKAALLLTTLDAATAAELLKGVDASTVQELAVELSYLDAAGHRERPANRRGRAPVLQDRSSRSRLSVQEFPEGDAPQHGRAKTKPSESSRRSRSFSRSATRSCPSARRIVPTLAAVLETEHPQAIAVVLSELPPKRGSEVLGLLSESVRVSAISRMTSVGSITPEAKMRIAQMVRTRLEAAGANRRAEQPSRSVRSKPSARSP